MTPTPEKSQPTPRPRPRGMRRGGSLVARLMLVMALSGAALAGLSWWLHVTLAEQAVNRAGLDRVVDRLTLPLIALWEAAPADRESLARTLVVRRRPVRLLLGPPDLVPLPDHPLAAALDRKIEDTLRQAGITTYRLGTLAGSSRSWSPMPPMSDHHEQWMAEMHGDGEDPPPDPAGFRRTGPVLVLAMPLDDRGWIVSASRFGSHLIQPRPPMPIYPFTIGAIALVIALALWAVWRTSLPLKQFTLAAERLGRDVGAVPLDEQTGPREVRQAAQAFNEMQRRIRGFIDARTRMLAAISHDLRTPITRLRLRAEFIDDEEQQQRMLADLDEMERMISTTLAVLRDDVAEETSRRVDLAALAQAVVDDAAETGINVSYAGPDSLPFQGRPLALKRALANLVGNAGKYAATVEVTLGRRDNLLIISVADDGPGIPESHLNRVFEPFYRVDGSRSRDTGGSGLGLSVVHMVALAHGGTVELANRPQGGLLARLILPLPA